MSESAPSRVRRALTRFISPQDVLHAEEEQAQSSRLGGTPVGSLQGRCKVTVSGTLHAVTLRPRAGVPALEAEIYDGSGTLAVVWLGRRQIPGVECGRRIRVEGLVADSDGRRVVYNPRYELIPADGE